MKNNKSVIFPRTTFLFVFKWLVMALIVGFLAGSASAFFLVSLNWVTNWRETHSWIIWFLPIGGFIVGAAYYYLGQDVVKGNNQLIEEFHSPSQVVPLKMAPLVLFGTLVTHLFGGSAGREGRDARTRHRPAAATPRPAPRRAAAASAGRTTGWSSNAADLP